jgi:hypothetical protein
MDGKASLFNDVMAELGPVTQGFASFGAARRDGPDQAAPDHRDPLDGLFTVRRG